MQFPYASLLLSFYHHFSRPYSFPIPSLYPSYLHFPQYASNSALSFPWVWKELPIFMCGCVSCSVIDENEEIWYAYFDLLWLLDVQESCTGLYYSQNWTCRCNCSKIYFVIVYNLCENCTCDMITYWNSHISNFFFMSVLFSFPREWAVRLFLIHKILPWLLGPKIMHLEVITVSFSLSSQMIVQCQKLFRTASFHMFCNSLCSNLCIIWCYVIWVNPSIIKQDIIT